MPTRPTENLPGWSPTTNTTEPSSEQKSSGWSINQIAPSSAFNWIWLSMSVWLLYFSTALAGDRVIYDGEVTYVARIPVGPGWGPGNILSFPDPMGQYYGRIFTDVGNKSQITYAVPFVRHVDDNNYASKFYSIKLGYSCENTSGTLLQLRAYWMDHSTGTRTMVWDSGDLSTVVAGTINAPVEMSAGFVPVVIPDSDSSLIFEATIDNSGASNPQHLALHYIDLTYSLTSPETL